MNGLEDRLSTARLVSSLVILGGLAVAMPVIAALFGDDFDRPDSLSVGNGWTEVDGTNLESSLASGSLVMQQTGGLSALAGDGQNTRIYRPAIGNTGIVVSGLLQITMGPPGGAQQVARVVVRSNGTAGTGVYVWPNSGAVSRPVCGGPTGLLPPDCWQGDGFGFQAFTDSIDRSDGGVGWLQIVDEGLELAGTPFSFLNGLTYEWRMTISADNHVELSVWNGAEPTTPTLTFSNGGAPYTPTANGPFWQVEVQNGNDDIGLSHSHTTIWDGLSVEPALSVDIDVKPGSDPNCFNLNGHGVIPVAILGSAEIEVLAIDLESLLFDGLAVRVRGNRRPLCAFENVDQDTFLDLVCHFEDEPANWTGGTAEGTLTGTLDDGRRFTGTDSICIVP